MIPGKYDIKIHRGSTWKITISAQHTDGSPIDFDNTYTSIRMQIRPPWVEGMPAQAPLLELTTTNGRISFLEAGAKILLQIPSADTAGLTFDEGKYDLELVKAGTPEEVDKLLCGLVTVQGEVTV